jgi:hypothetical protein
MKTIQEIFNAFYKNHLETIDKTGKIKIAMEAENYQFVLGYAFASNVNLPQDVQNAGLFLKFKLLQSRQKGCTGENLFQEDYTVLTGPGTLQKMARGSQDQLNPDFFEKNKKIYLEVKTATIYVGNKFIFEQLRLKDPRINYYIFLGITPEGRFYIVLNKKDIKLDTELYGAKLSPQHSTTDQNATYQWHPSYEELRKHIVRPDELDSVIQ